MILQSLPLSLDTDLSAHQLFLRLNLLRRNRLVLGSLRFRRNILYDKNRFLRLKILDSKKLVVHIARFFRWGLNRILHQTLSRDNTAR